MRSPRARRDPNETLLILTHPELNVAIELRAADILEGRVPADLTPASV
jgi:hypothetical protein